MKMNKLCIMLIIIIISMLYLPGNASAQGAGDCIECSSCTLFETWKFICTFIGQICTIQGLPSNFCQEQVEICEESIDSLVAECRRICKENCNEPDTCNGGAPDGKCEDKENCPQDASACDDKKCYEPTCTNGCGKTPVPSGSTDEACGPDAGCAKPPCSCDGNGNCATVPVTPECHPHEDPSWINGNHKIKIIEKGCTESNGCSEPMSPSTLSTEYLVEVKDKDHCGEKLWLWLDSSMTPKQPELDKCYNSDIMTYAGDCNAYVIRYLYNEVDCPECEETPPCARIACEYANTNVPCMCGSKEATANMPWCCAADSNVFPTEHDCVTSPSCHDEQCRIIITFNKSDNQFLLGESAISSDKTEYCPDDSIVITIEFLEDGKHVDYTKISAILKKPGNVEIDLFKYLKKISTGIYEIKGSVGSAGVRTLEVKATFGDCKDVANASQYTVLSKDNPKCAGGEEKECDILTTFDEEYYCEEDRIEITTEFRNKGVLSDPTRYGAMMDTINGITDITDDYNQISTGVYVFNGSVDNEGYHSLYLSAYFDGCHVSKTEEFFVYSKEECPHETVCTDTDGGKNYYVKGYATTDNGHTRHEDSCTYYKETKTYTLHETYCENNEIKTEAYKCPDTCKDGACVREAERGYDVCNNNVGWSEPESATQNCHGQGGYIKDCCCCLLTSHIHDLSDTFNANSKIEIEYMPGFTKGCTSTMNVYSSEDGKTWNLFYTAEVTQETWSPKTTYKETLTVPRDFRYIKINIPKCYNDYSSARVLVGGEEVPCCTTTGKDVLVLHDQKKYAFVGFYLWLNALPIEDNKDKWEVLQRTIDWATDKKAHSGTKIIVFGYRKTDRSLSAIREYLVSAGYSTDNIETRGMVDVKTLSSSYYQKFDLVIYAWGYPHPASEIIASSKPFITMSPGHTDDMGIGKGTSTMHESRSLFYVVNNDYYPTKTYNLEKLNFTSKIWTDAIEATNHGITLMGADKCTAKDVLILHDQKKYAFVGFYLWLNALPIEDNKDKWEVLQRTIDWATDKKAHSGTKIIVFGYRKTDRSLSAIREYLVSAGYSTDNIETRGQVDARTLNSSYYQKFDLVIYAWGYPHPASEIIASSKPFITMSPGHTDDMSIGKGESTMHESRSLFYIANNDYYPTETYDLGELNFASKIWTDAIEATGHGIRLMSADKCTAKGEPDCIGDGEIVREPGSVKGQCCAGLHEIGSGYRNGKSYCTSEVCGNGECKALENEWNCPKDCKEVSKYLTVTSPNGGEKWVQGNKYKITWKLNNTLVSSNEKVGIYLVDDSRDDPECSSQGCESWKYRIAWNLPAAPCEYTWTVPESDELVKVGNKYKIRIGKIINTQVEIGDYDESDDHFSIVKPGEECTPEGGMNYFGKPPCCEGLVSVSNAAPGSDGKCIARPDGSGYCTKCGDGRCGKGENVCNCPKDCGCRSNIECEVDETGSAGRQMFCEFPEDTCRGPGKCTEKPVVCPRLYDPVCGCDSKTYSNDCVRQAAGVSKKYNGKCREEPSCKITSASIISYCKGGSSSCKAGEQIRFNVHYDGSNCPSESNMYIQIDALSADGSCRISYIGGDISGIYSRTSGSTGVWTIPVIPDKCKGKKITPTLVGLYNGGPPGTGKGLDWSDAIADSFGFAGGSEKCTDTDGGRDYYKKGTVSLQQVFSDGKVKLIDQKTDYCEGFDTRGMTDTMVVEYYCKNNEIKSEMRDCPNKCNDGACIKGKEPYCSEIATESEGWYLQGKRINTDNCDGCYAVCKYAGTRSEGWYSSCNSKLIKREDCGGVEKDCYSDKDCEVTSTTLNQFCEFPEDTCRGPGKCTEKPSICPRLYDPVCGCDSKTYSNDCVRQSAGVSKKYNGKCREEPFMTATSPNGGEQWMKGNAYDITWSLGPATSVNDKVAIYLADESQNGACTENGACCYTCTNWKLIASGVPTSFGKYAWKIPANQKTGSKYKIFIRTISSSCFTGCVNDMSDNYFSIIEEGTHKCTDTDSGRDYYKRGGVYKCYGSACTTPTPDFCIKFDMPPSSTYSGKAVKEFYCDGNGIKSETFECPNGCNDGACIKGKEPYCSAIGSRSEGWYHSDGLITWDNCDGCYAVCKHVGTDSEGWYSSCNSKLIKHEDCMDTSCKITSASIIPICKEGASSSCETGKLISFSVSYNGNGCPSASDIYIQIDAKSTDGACKIEYVGGDMSGIYSGNAGSKGTWTIPAIPDKCKGKTITPTLVGLYSGGPPGTGEGLDWSDAITGSFELAGNKDRCTSNGGICRDKCEYGETILIGMAYSCPDSNKMCCKS